MWFDPPPPGSTDQKEKQNENDVSLSVFDFLSTASLH
jgi:hypothetical protein